MSGNSYIIISVLHLSTHTAVDTQSSSAVPHAQCPPEAQCVRPACHVATRGRACRRALPPHAPALPRFFFCLACTRDPHVLASCTSDAAAVSAVPSPALAAEALRGFKKAFANRGTSIMPCTSAGRDYAMRGAGKPAPAPVPIDAAVHVANRHPAAQAHRHACLQQPARPRPRCPYLPPRPRPNPRPRASTVTPCTGSGAVPPVPRCPHLLPLLQPKPRPKGSTVP